MTYSNKLTKFNETEKYQKELGLLRSLVGTGKLLDYGCGNGYAAELLEADGYDIHPHNVEFNYQLDPFDFYDTIYFMHSFAHIETPVKVLTDLKRWLIRGAKIVIITPNAAWLNLLVPTDYKPDPTVVAHFTQLELERLLDSCGYEIIHSGQFGARRGQVNERLFITAKPK